MIKLSLISSAIFAAVSVLSCFSNNIREVPWNEAPEWAKNYEFEMPKNWKIVPRRSVKEQVDSLFDNNDFIATAMCECFEKNDSFLTSKDECIEAMEYSPDYKKCFRDVFEYQELIGGFSPGKLDEFVNCDTKLAINIANYFDYNCSNINNDDYHSTWTYLSQFEKCELNLATNLRIAQCEKIDH